jgi:RNA polymerase sigma-70 factor (ECF subfamily)
MDDIRAPGVLDSPEALVRLAQAGDEAAFARIVRLHRAAMVRVSLVAALDMEVALEAVAVAWAVAWDRIGSVADAARLRQWLCSIAVQEACDIVRNGSNRPDLGDETGAVRLGLLPAVDELGTAATGEDRWAPNPDLVRRLGRLRVEDRALLALHDVAGLTPTELGRATGLPPSSALARIARLREDLGGDTGALGGDLAGAEERVAEGLRALADVPVGHVNIDAVARTARITHGDRRRRRLSIVLAAILALPVLAVPYLGESGAWPALLSSAANPSPAPTMDAGPMPSERAH